eukprot:CAMPEP_0174820062 /NCGR_PEP_ID=MMETSP1107-20130205/3626_1 /TAXON_ID=36770 /ORGANISM="Paraphysomonas vestita, Strain GFlagA" /LENGTH=120 /DNA_ID=CAMNT_0016034643 /DNA_START=119 /DNA_END=478 /DNA_ORIENTATION=+
MGAAASIEMQKPTDASDILITGSLKYAKDEVIRLRELLGQYAKDAGFAEVIYDASDLVLGENEQDDFERCVDEVAHIRAALRMSTQKSRRQTRVKMTGSEDIQYQDFQNKRRSQSDISSD